MEQGVVTEIKDLAQEAFQPKQLRGQDGTEFVFVNGQIVKEIPRQVRAELALIKVETLGSLVKLAEGKIAKDAELQYVIRVDSPRLVSVIDISEDMKYHIVIQASAQCPTAGVLAGFVSVDQVLSELRECFIQTSLVEDLSDTLRTIKIEDITELTDNGLGREVSVKARVTSAKKSDSTVFNLELIPIRTFYEVQPVPSTFTMRWKRSGNDVNVRLIEQLSHEWKYKQMQVVAEFLNQQDSLAGIPILV